MVRSGQANISCSVVDDMAERCDRLEQEMMMRDGGFGIDTRSKSSIKSGDSLV